MSVVIALSGLHGTGKSTYARNIAKEFNLRHISAGELFRQIAFEKNLSLAELSSEAEKNPEIDRLLDERTRMEIEKGNLVVDGILSCWIARDYSALKIYFSTPYAERISRIASRDKVPYDDAEKVTSLREEVEQRRLKKLYNIDIFDLSIYDLVLNTSLFPIELNTSMLNNFVREYIRVYGG